VTADHRESSFLSPARSEAEEIRRDIARVTDSPVVSAMLLAAEGSLAILNGRREVLAVNDRFLAGLGIEEPSAVLGLRLGEALHCGYSGTTDGGCGTTAYCPTCGMAVAIVGTLVREKTEQRRCCLRIEGQDGSLDDRCFAVRGVPLEVGTRRFVAIFIGDITREERRAAFEKSFLHDLNNILGSLSGVVQLQPQAVGKEVGQLRSDLEEITSRLQRETELQRILVDDTAEQLEFRRDEVDPLLVCESLERLLAAHPASRGRRILTRVRSMKAAKLITDADLLERALLNLLINACEASPDGGEVKLTVEDVEGGCRFSVWNASYLPPPLARRIFQRHFTTKEGEGRGFGTFGARLITESLLGGSLSFTSTREEGTTFRLQIPRIAG